MKIYLSSYLNNNLGDDIMIDMVCKRYPNHQFYVGNSNCLDRIACQNENLQVIRTMIPARTEYGKRAVNKFLSYLGIPKLQLLSRFRKYGFDMNLELGGSIFMQVTPRSWVNTVRDSRYIVNHCRYNLVVGSNFGPFSDMRFLEAYRKLFPKYDTVSFRDQKSYQLFSDLHNIQRYSDIVYNLNIKHMESNAVGISVISMNNVGVRNHLKKYISGMVALIKALQEKGIQISLISFCENEGDLDTCRMILEQGEFADTVEVFNHVNVADSLDYISKLRAMVCTRFHASVLAIASKIPMLPVIYSQKTTAMLDDLDYSGYRWNIKDGEMLDMESALEQLSRIPELNYQKTEDAQGHFQQLDAILATDAD